MRQDCAQPRPRKAAAGASASIVALVAVAVAVSAAQAANPTGHLERTQGVREVSSARAVAAAVTAVVRDLVGHDTIDTSIDVVCCDALAWLPTPANLSPTRDDSAQSHAPPIAPQLLNIPPPTN